MFERVEDAMQKIDKSILLYNKLPYYWQYDGGFFYEGSPLLIGGIPVHIDVTEAVELGQLSLRAFDLGYANTPQGSHYLVRVNARQYKAGLCTNNCHKAVFFPDGNIRYEPLLIQQLRSNATGKTIIGDYPTFAEGIRALRNRNVNSIAVSRRTLLTLDEIGLIKVSYFGQTLGWINKQERVLVPKKFELNAFSLRRELAIDNDQLELVEL